MEPMSEKVIKDKLKICLSLVEFSAFDLASSTTAFANFSHWKEKASNDSVDLIRLDQVFTNSELFPILGLGLDRMSDDKRGSSIFNELLLLWVLLMLLTSKYDSNEMKQQG